MVSPKYPRECPDSSSPAIRGQGDVDVMGSSKVFLAFDVRDGLSAVSVAQAQGSAWLVKSLHDTHMSKDTLVPCPG